MLETDAIIAIIKEFFSGPIDQIIINLLLYFGWIPIVIALIRGLLEVWKDRKQAEWVAKQRQVLLAIDIPRESEQSPKSVENIFAACMGAKSSPNFVEKWIQGKMSRPFSFEIVSIDGYIQYYIRCNVRHRDLIESAIYAQYPDAEIMEAEDYTENVPSTYPDEHYDMYGYEFTLEKPDYFPIRTWLSFEHSLSQELKDPMAVLLEALSKLKAGEQIWIQVIVEPISQNWKRKGDAYVKETFGIKEEVKEHPAESAVRSVLAVPKAIINEVVGSAEADSDKGFALNEEMWKAFKVTEQEREIVKSVVGKIGKIGFNTKIRYVYVGRREVFKKGMRNDMIKGYFRQFHHLNLNRFGTASTVNPKDDYFWQRWFYVARQNKLMQAYKSRSWIKGAAPSILNVEELATIWHFPGVAVKAPLIKKTVSKRAEPPPALSFATEEEEYEITPKTEVSVGVGVGEDEEVEAGRIVPTEVVSGPEITGIHAPTRSEQMEMTEDFPVNLPEVEEKIDEQKNKIPDAIRVLIEPGVELEDTDEASGFSEEENNNVPKNLPL